MKALAKISAVTVVALLASFSWAAVYPYAISSAVGDILWVIFFAFFLLAFLLPPQNWRVEALTFGVLSAIAGLVAVVWSGLSWRFGLWFPELPRLLHRLFSTDGEASYSASEGQLFLALFLALSALLLGFRLSRRKEETQAIGEGSEQ